MRYKVVSVERNKYDDGGVVVCHKCVDRYTNRHWRTDQRLGEIRFVMDTNLPEEGDFVTATFSWKSARKE